MGVEGVRSSDTIYVHQNISDGDTIVSGNEKFELGFFSLRNSKDRYLGIWFKNASPQTVVWVANREIPLKDNLGMVKLDDEGNLFLVNGNSKVIWSSNSSTSGTFINHVAQLLDMGNLVIKNGNETLIWQSFDYPGDTYLPGMKLGKNFITGRETYLTSWRSVDDPSPGLNSSFHSKKRAVMAVTLSTAAVLTLLGLILAFYTKRKWKKRSDAEREGK
ncbi:hypothetical protein R6Q59_029676 [Mikania micrantha]